MGIGRGGGSDSCGRPPEGGGEGKITGVEDSRNDPRPPMPRASRTKTPSHHRVALLMFVESSEWF